MNEEKCRKTKGRKPNVTPVTTYKGWTLAKKSYRSRKTLFFACFPRAVNQSLFPNYQHPFVPILQSVVDHIWMKRAIFLLRTLLDYAISVD
jgi:hypothetical protein